MATEKKSGNGWKIAYWALLICWVVGAVLSMAKVRGGFLTSYLADLTFPPYFYIALRGKGFDRPLVIKPVRWFGQTALRTALSIFTVGAVTEISSNFWPHGPFGGTFDPLDIVAYAVGLIVCYYFDRR